jgi:hypothetical protein
MTGNARQGNGVSRGYIRYNITPVKKEFSDCGRRKVELALEGRNPIKTREEDKKERGRGEESQRWTKVGYRRRSGGP